MSSVRLAWGASPLKACVLREGEGLGYSGFFFPGNMPLGERVVLGVKTTLSPAPLDPTPQPPGPQPLEFTALCSSSTLVNGHCSGEKEGDVFGFECIVSGLSLGQGMGGLPPQCGRRQVEVALGLD